MFTSSVLPATSSVATLRPISLGTSASLKIGQPLLFNLLNIHFLFSVFVPVAGSVATLRPIAVGTSADLKIGQSLFAIGNPYGLSGTLSAGLVSGLNRAIPSPVGGRIYGVIQVRCACQCSANINVCRSARCISASAR